jgi:hypothetical protein
MHQHEQAGDERRIHRQVERIGNRRERQLGAEQARVVVGERVAGHEQRLAEREQVPRQAPMRVVANDRTILRDLRGSRMSHAQRTVALVGRDRAVPPPDGDEWDRAGPRLRAIAAARPGPVHERLRALRDAGQLTAVISDTDDVLLDEAGVVADVELRGSARESVCPACGYTEPLLCLLEMLPEPHCAACGHLLRPGTRPEPAAYAAAERLVREADLLLLAGAAPDHPLVRLARHTEDITAG